MPGDGIRSPILGKLVQYPGDMLLEGGVIQWHLPRERI